MGVHLTRVKIRGYKTIKDLGEDGLELRPLNILIGANGAGKSNFISFFRMLSWSLASDFGGLSDFIASFGGASKFLHDGPAITREIETELRFVTGKGDNDYGFRLGYAADETLIFMDERYRFSDRSKGKPAEWRSLGGGHREAKLITQAMRTTTAKTILNLLRQCKIFQFHNTSFTARMKLKWHVNDGRWLKEDAGNLPAFLYYMREEHPEYYRRVEDTVRLIAPFFNGFVLEPLRDYVLLQWRERGSDMLFDASVASDGMLRAMALIALLNQKEEDLPRIIILDEPELGLHPYAITLIAGMIKSVSRTVQVIIATQSAGLVDEFNADEIIVVDRIGRDSHFARIDQENLAEWLKDYTISELWEKNVLGGRPSR